LIPISGGFKKENLFYNTFFIFTAYWSVPKSCENCDAFVAVFQDEAEVRKALFD